MADEKKPSMKGHCPTCGGERNAAIRGSHRVHGSDEDYGTWGAVDYYILECGGCDAVFFKEIATNSEDFDENGPIEHITYYPAPAKRSRPEWFSLLKLEGGLYRLLDETYNALDVDARVLSATGARTIFDRASELLKIKSELTFKEKLEQLQNGGHISSSERGHLDILTDAGSAAAHRGWKPTLEQLNTVMLILEGFIHRKFVLEREVKTLKSELPKRKRRRKK